MSKVLQTQANVSLPPAPADEVVDTEVVEKVPCAIQAISSGGLFVENGEELTKKTNYFFSSISRSYLTRHYN